MPYIPSKLKEVLASINLVCGHYGVGKTNFSCNLALDLAQDGFDVTAVDLDVVNPYFRTTEQRSLLEGAGVRLISPVCAEAGTSLDIPSLPSSMGPAFDMASKQAPVIVDVGGDDVGSTALGRFMPAISQNDYCMLGVLNVFRNLVQDPADAVQNLHEIEDASRLKLTALVSNAHLKDDTTSSCIERGYEYAQEVAHLMGIPLVGVTIPRSMAMMAVPQELVYPVQTYIRTPWE